MKKKGKLRKFINGILNTNLLFWNLVFRKLFLKVNCNFSDGWIVSSTEESTFHGWIFHAEDVCSTNIFNVYKKDCTPNFLQ